MRGLCRQQQPQRAGQEPGASLVWALPRGRRGVGAALKRTFDLPECGTQGLGGMGPSQKGAMGLQFRGWVEEIQERTVSGT